MEENPILQRIEALKRQSQIFFLLMLAGFLCTAFLYYKLRHAHHELETYKNQQIKKQELENNNCDSLKNVLSNLLIQVQSKIPKSDTAISSQISKVFETPKYAGYLVYIQKRGNQETEITKKLMVELRKKGFLAPGIEQINRDFKNGVYYFNDKDQAMAKEVLSLLVDIFKSMDRQVPLDLTVKKSVVKAPEGQLEVWLNLSS